MKLLLWLACIAILVSWWMRGKREVAASSQNAASQSSNAAAESMLQCRQCGVHFPASEAIKDSHGSIFCCDEHRRLSSRA